MAHPSFSKPYLCVHIWTLFGPLTIHISIEEKMVLSSQDFLDRTNHSFFVTATNNTFLGWSIVPTNDNEMTIHGLLTTIHYHAYKIGDLRFVMHNEIINKNTDRPMYLDMYYYYHWEERSIDREFELLYISGFYASPKLGLSADFNNFCWNIMQN